MAINLPSSEWTAPIRTGQVCRKHYKVSRSQLGSHLTFGLLHQVSIARDRTVRVWKVEDDSHLVFRPGGDVGR